jgi:Pentapeptide repeats (8 copies)
LRAALSADSKHVEALRRGPRSWNQWRAQNPSLTPNLTDITLSAAERQMGPISGGPINFAFARLRHASLRFATLSGANLEMADLTDADLSDARLDGANLSGAEFGDAVLERVDFAGARLGGANFAGANLKEARNLTQAQIDEALGDSLTALPPHLTRPEGWGGGAGQTVSDLLGRNGKHQDPANGKAPPARGTTTSWLVGGPRTSLMTRAG